VYIALVVVELNRSAVGYFISDTQVQLGLNKDPTKLTPEQLKRYEWLQSGWQNIDRNTKSITRIHIYQVKNELHTHIWGRCSNKQCDWGKENIFLDEDGKTIMIVWDRSYIKRTQILRRINDRLEVTTHSQFKDTVRSPRTSKALFEKKFDYDWGPVEGWVWR
jgi:hypothetical protein